MLLICHFYSYNVIENEAHFVLECPLYNFSRIEFRSLFENVVLRSLSIEPSSKKWPLSHGGYHTPPLQRFSYFDTIMMCFQSHKPLGFLDFKINFISFSYDSQIYLVCHYISNMLVTRWESTLMPRSYQNFRPVPTVKLLRIMLRYRCWPIIFHSITAGDANGWCLNQPV